MLKVERIEKGQFKVTGEGIDAIYNTYGEKVTGKGSRNHKEEIKEAVQKLLHDEYEARKNVAEQKAKDFHDNLKNVDLFELYNVTVNSYGDYGHYEGGTDNKLLSGHEILSEDRAVAAEKVKINNTDIYDISRRHDSYLKRKAIADKRIFIIMDRIYVTGLALKELLQEGFKTYGDGIHLASAWSHDQILKSNNERINTEMERAKNTPEQVQPNEIVGYTAESQPIKRAWFASKPCNMNDIKDLRWASYEEYAIIKTFKLTKEQFDAFSVNFDLETAGITFEGGSTSATLAKEHEETDFSQWTDAMLSQYWLGSYRICAEVVCSDYDYSFIIDPQGYNYARYISLVQKQQPTPDKPNKNNKVVSLEEKRTEKENAKTEHEAVLMSHAQEVAFTNEEQQPQQTNNTEEDSLMEKQYVLNRETGKIELHFTKQEYKALTEEQKVLLKRQFLFSGSRSAWVSRSKNNHYYAIETAEKLGFINGGKVGERLTFAEELERQTEKAEAKAERYEEYASNAQKRGESLQKELNSLHGDIAFFTQPIIRGHAGSESFAKRRQRIFDRYGKGFEEYKKSAYFQERAETTRATADQSKLKNRTYLNNRIEECKKNIKVIENNIVWAEENNKEDRIEDYLEKYEYEVDKLGYFENCLDEIGGIQYNKDNLKPGYYVKIRGRWNTVIKANTKTVEVTSEVTGFGFKYPYAEIQELKIPEGWIEPKNTIENPFNIGDIVYCTNISGNQIIYAFQVVKKTPKGVTLLEIKVENNKPIQNEFIGSEQIKKNVRKDRNGKYTLDYRSWILYVYKNEEQQAI